MKTEYNAKNENFSKTGVVTSNFAQECPTSQRDENVRRTEKYCNSCSKVKSVKDFYFKKTVNCYSSKCKDCVRAQQKQYTENNKDKISKAKKLYYSANLNIIKSRRKNHNIDKEKRKNNRRSWENNRLKTDLNYRLSKNMRKRIFNVMKAQGQVKSDRTEKLIGCSISFLVAYIEKLFKPGMSWQNYGMWHIDHIMPLSLFDLTNKQELLQAMNYKNLQPLWAVDNIKKGAKIQVSEVKDKKPLR